MTKLTNKIALEAAISALYSSEIKEYHFAGDDEVFSATEIVGKLLQLLRTIDQAG